MSDKTGGPAFPTVKLESPGEAQAGQFFTTGDKPGMTLRDYFAAKAMASYIIFDRNNTQDEATISKIAYLMADAMIAERNKT